MFVLWGWSFPKPLFCLYSFGCKQIVFPEIDFDLFGLVARPIADSIAQDMLLEKKPNVKKFADKCVNFMINGLLGGK